MESQRRIAILGGGIGALSAAYALTTEPGWSRRYTVEIYAMGWRLGGKGASGRLPDGRIVEHGLHVWGGYYEHAFSLMRHCYGELGRRPGQPLATWRQAFVPRHSFTMHEHVDGRWLPWTVELPGNDATPGDGREPSVRDRLSLLIRALGRMVAGSQRDHGIGWRDRARRGRLMAEFSRAYLRGVVADGVLTRGTAHLDDLEFRDWLRRHGAGPAALDSPLARCIYDVVFAYAQGDPRRPSLAAGRAIHTLQRFLLGYKGAVFWDMHGGGMGDVVFAPLYLVLRRRGVRFHFFHQVTELGLDSSQRRVGRISMIRQADPQGEYEPLIDVGGLPCWPASPRVEQLRGGEALRSLDLEGTDGGPCAAPDAPRIELRLHRDFDDVVLGIPLGALSPLCRELCEARPAWRRMLRIPTVCTQSIQVWTGERPMPRPARDARLRRARPRSCHAAPRTNETEGLEEPRRLLCAGRQPLNTWADMRHLLPAEGWPSAGLAYLCGPMPTPAAGECPRALVRSTYRRFVRAQARWLWSPKQRPDREGAVVAEYLRANVSPSERYVQTPPGSVRHRLAADGSGFENLVLAGDWVATEYSLGTIESACIAGLDAARALGASDRASSVASEPSMSSATATVPPVVTAPRYIERGGDGVYRHPIVARRGRLWSMPVPADRAKLHRLLDRYFNAICTPTLRFVPAGDHVWVCAAELPHVTSGHPHDRHAGSVQERELVAFVPVALCRAVEGTGAWRAERIGLVPQYMVLDNPWSVASGREVFGFPKSLGRIECDGAHPTSVVAHTLVLPEHDREQRATQAPLYRVESLGDRSEIEASAGALEWPAIIAASLDTAPRWTHWSAALRTLGRGPLPLFFLKQIRDACDPDRACYQAIIEAPCRVDRLGAVTLDRGRYRVTIGSYASHPAADELGVGPEPVEISTSYRVELDFTIGTGRSLAGGRHARA